MKRALAIVLLAILLSPTLAPAWSFGGHRTVAAIAWDNMTAQARARAVFLLMHGPARARLSSLRPPSGTPAERDRALFLNAATWPDLVRNQRQDWHVYHRPTWHYADFYWSLSVVDGQLHHLGGPDAVNAGERIARFRTELTNPTVKDTTKAVDLAWLLHLVGDIHQPLHCSSRVTVQDPLPQGDRGGNGFMLGGTRNLHAYWDEILDSAAPRARGEDSLAYARRSARRIEQAHPRPPVTTASRDVTQWERACLELAQTVVYRGVARGSALSVDYQTGALQVAEKQIALAGYRLALLLNDALK